MFGFLNGFPFYILCLKLWAWTVLIFLALTDGSSFCFVLWFWPFHRPCRSALIGWHLHCKRVWMIANHYDKYPDLPIQSMFSILFLSGLLNHLLVFRHSHLCVLYAATICNKKPHVAILHLVYTSRKVLVKVMNKQVILSLKKIISPQSITGFHVFCIAIHGRKRVIMSWPVQTIGQGLDAWRSPWGVQ